jgi:hypothetical protein
VPNLALSGGGWLYPAPDETQAKELCDLDPDFFNREIAGKRQIEWCAFLRDVAGHNLVERTRRFVVPPAALAEAKKLAKGCGFSPDRVVSADLAEFSPKA